MDSYFSLTNVAAAAISFYALFGTIFFNRKSSRSHQENNKTLASSLLAPTPHIWIHHVFPSFHGADVRTNFLSHVVKELKSKGIDLFVDNDIERSKSIGPELVEAIRGSRIAIVLLSKNYASSTWCLNELVEIMNCREEFGQTVMSLFYQVDPTDVKKQTGDFGQVFKQTCKGKTEDEIRRWKRALTEVAQIAGYHSTNWETEAEMIEDIATDVSDKLNLSAPCSDFDGLVGMEPKMTEMRSLLQLDSAEVRKIGIWGPSGIGKTTIARSIFNQHSQDFQLSVFIDNIKRNYAIPACSDDYSMKLKLQKHFVSQLTNETDIKNFSHLGVVKDRLKDKKVLVVLDDVDRSVHLEAMAKETSWFGPGSRIIITTQDRKVLKASGIEHIHKVDLPSHDEALQMFCMYAFDQKYPKDGFQELAWKVIDLVGRLPLGLKFMGSYFRGMSDQDWTEAIPRLKAHLDRNGDIASILNFSYDGLHNEEKKLFLHIACFFNREPVDIVEGCLAKCFPDVTQGVRVLVEKSLISIVYKRIEMAELLVHFGRNIVREQSDSQPGKCQFLNEAIDIDEVLSDDKSDTGSVIGIDLNEDIACTSERAFERLSYLQFLRIYGKGVNPQSMNYISQKLRVLIWPGSEMTCIPSNFNPKLLVKLEMPYSKLEKLWEGMKPLNNLKWMDLKYSTNLVELPDLSTATNLQKLNLEHCSSLVKFSFSIGNAISLQELDFSKCSSMVELHFSIGNAVNLKGLYLGYCSSLVELSFSIGNAINLQKLDLYGCSRLVKLSSSIGSAVTLQEMNLSYCSSLVRLPFSFENAVNLKRIYLEYCSSLVDLPFSVGNAINLQTLFLNGCSSLMELPSSMRNLGRLWKFELKGCSKLELNLASINLESLEELDLSGCSSLKCYTESSAGVQELDPWIGGRISRLQKLVLRGMRKLVSLPQLPDSLLELDAENCESLERLDCSFRNPGIRLNLANCFKLNQEAIDLIIKTPTIQFAVLPIGEVPRCFTCRSFGSSLTMKLNQLHVGKSIKFKAGFIYTDDDDLRLVSGRISITCEISSGGDAITSYEETAQFFRRQLHTFMVEVNTEEMTSTEFVFKFDISYSKDYADDYGLDNPIFKYWRIIECGIVPLLEVPLLSFRDVENFEPKDVESFGDGDEDHESTNNEDYKPSDKESSDKP